MHRKFKEAYYFHQESNIYAFKYAIAFLIGYGVMQFIPGGKAQWVIITIAVIMGSQAILGHQILKSFLRLLGTFTGAAIGILALHLPQNFVTMSILIFLLAFAFGLFASKNPDRSYIATLGIVTFSMIVLIPDSTIDTAFFRVLDISVGIVISLLVSTLLFSLSTRRAFSLQSHRNFKTINKFIDAIFIEERDRRNDPEMIELETKLQSGITKQRSIVSAIRFENIRKSTLKGEILYIIRYTRALYHYLLFIDVALFDIRWKGTGNQQLISQDLNSIMAKLIEYLDLFQIESHFVNAEKMIQEIEVDLNTLFHDSSVKTEDLELEIIRYSLK